MKWLLLLSIRIYWLIPARRRPRCLFKESCSRYVYRITLLHGYKCGINSLKLRRKQCCAGFSVLSEGKVRLTDGSVIDIDLTRLVNK
ncbi:MAG: membrane protein insertion efficiency factor YidD [Terrimonas ferruginea]|nr:membrane protein insertion efficiency factor YidD [Terrimonas ferruginea]